MTPTWSVIPYLLLIRTSLSGEPELKCPSKGEYRHGLPQTSCREYYVCRGHHLIDRHACPPGTQYSPISKVCRVGGNCYDIVCTGRVDGRYADTTEGCTRWFECRGGAIAELGSCPSGYHFSEQKDECAPSFNSVCPTPRYTSGLILKISNPCFGQPNGFFSVLDSSIYVKCDDQVEIETHSCPAGQAHDGQECVTIRQQGNDVCTSRKDGYHLQEDSHCTEYFLCRNGHIVLKSRCPAGTMFDGQSCKSLRNAACPFNSRCIGLPNGYYPDTNNACRTYYYCKDNLVLKEESCSSGLVWNGQKCVSSRDFKCFEPTESAECFRKKGYITDISSQCRQYHYCSQGTKMTFSCPQGTIFNGMKCVPTEEYSCLAPTLNSCYGMESGYYTDRESNCRSYFYCAKGNKITYVCPPNEVFDGSECVPNSQFKCHYVNTECVQRPNGYQRKPRSLRDYIYCSNGIKLITLQCQPHEVYDGEKCVNHTQYRNMCRKVRFGHLTDPSCRVYYICRDGEVVKSGVCLDKFVFDGTSCVPPSKGTCDRGSIKSCEGAPNGFYADFNTDCQQYYYCIYGQRTQLSCTPGLVHNGDRCVPRHQYVCPSLSINLT